MIYIYIYIYHVYTVHRNPRKMPMNHDKPYGSWGFWPSQFSNFGATLGLAHLSPTLVDSVDHWRKRLKLKKEKKKHVPRVLMTDNLCNLYVVFSQPFNPSMIFLCLSFCWFLVFLLLVWYARPFETLLPGDGLGAPQSWVLHCLDVTFQWDVGHDLHQNQNPKNPSTEPQVFREKNQKTSVFFDWRPGVLILNPYLTRT